jgi:hypothetical protein
VGLETFALASLSDFFMLGCGRKLALQAVFSLAFARLRGFKVAV